MLSLLTVVPFAIARYVTWGRWIEIALAYVIWIMMLVLFAMTMHYHQRGWVLLIALMTTVIAIPLLVLVIKIGMWIRRRA
jgi:heme/copper-type cytochrome/quinol oxidase subunit 4